MEKYRRVKNPIGTEEKETTTNVIRITTKGSIFANYTYASKLLEKKDLQDGCVYLKAMGSALSTAVVVAEKLRSSKEGLHQVVKVHLVETVTRYEPIEEGLDVVETTRQLPAISIQLSYSIDAIDTTDVGYQKPLPAELIKRYHDRDQKSNKKTPRKPKKQGNMGNEQHGNDEQEEQEENKQDASEKTNVPTSPTKTHRYKSGRKTGKTTKETPSPDIEVVNEEEIVQEESTKKGPKRKKSAAKKQEKTKQVSNNDDVENETNGEVAENEVEEKEGKTRNYEKKQRGNGSRGGRRFSRGSRNNGQQEEASQDQAPPLAVEATT